MERYTIRPLLTLLRSDKNTFNRNDLAQVTAKVRNTMKRKAASPSDKERFSVFTEKKYLEILKTLTAAVPTGKITRAELIEATDKILQDANFVFIKKEHVPAHDNYFLPAPNAAPAARRHNRKNYAASTYDLAFYHPQSRKHREGHHQYQRPEAPREKPLQSVWYLRAEEYPEPERILFGNIQIDDQERFNWKKQAVGRIMLMPKNINLTMVQSAIQHALAKGKTEILFQAGDAAIYAQGLESPGKPISVLITEKNLAKYQKIYEEQLQKFAAVQAGDVNENEGTVVFNKTETEYTRTWADNYDFGLLNFLHNYDFEIDNIYFKKQIIGLYDAYYHEPTNLKRQLRLVNKIFNTPKLFSRQGNINDRPPQHAAKIKFLQKLLTPEKGKRRSQTAYLESLEPFLEKFGYKARVEQLDFAPLRGLPHRAQRPGALYIHSQYSGTDTVAAADYINPPRLGQRHFLFDYKQRWDKIQQQIDVFRVWDYYENRVPAELKKLKLTVEPQTLLRTRQTVRGGDVEKNRATGWKIVSGLEDWHTRPLISFANAPELKMDPVTMPELQTAAQKFGLSPAQVHIAHDWLLTAGRRRPALYDAGQDQVQLLDCQLELLAHEGLHRLVAQNAIPAREYRALVQAGRQLVTARSDLNKRLRARTAGAPDYPAGPARDEEYAALWVENLYTVNRAARRRLIGTEVPTLEKIIDYVCRVLEILGSYLQQDEALARSFMRRIEQAPAPEARTRQHRPAAIVALARG